MFINLEIMLKTCNFNRAVRYATLEAHYAHLCNINAATIMETNEWPRGIGTSGKSRKSTEGLFE